MLPWHPAIAQPIHVLFQVAAKLHYIPTALCNIICAKDQIEARGHSLRSSAGADTDLVVPFSRFKSFDSSVVFRLTKAWNSLRDVPYINNGHIVNVYNLSLPGFKIFLGRSIREA